MKTIAYYSGKIETNNRECFVGDQKVECPSTGGASTGIGDKLDLLPQISSLDKRSDPVFYAILLATMVIFLTLAILRVKIFSKTLREYIEPIWYLVLISLTAVIWQYLFGLRIEDNLMLLRISQWIWELCVAVSAYILVKKSDFGYGNVFFLGILYSLIIHGLKITVRYIFYEKTFLYLVDRFIYGSLLVMAMAFVLGSVFVYLKKKGR